MPLARPLGVQPQAEADTLEHTGARYLRPLVRPPPAVGTTLVYRTVPGWSAGRASGRLPQMRSCWSALGRGGGLLSALRQVRHTQGRVYFIIPSRRQGPIPQAWPWCLCS